MRDDDSESRYCALSQLYSPMERFALPGPMLGDSRQIDGWVYALCRAQTAQPEDICQCFRLR